MRKSPKSVEDPNHTSKFGYCSKFTYHVHEVCPAFQSNDCEERKVTRRDVVVSCEAEVIVAFGGHVFIIKRETVLPWGATILPRRAFEPAVVPVFRT